MQKIPLNLARPGMVLAKPVARGDGIVMAAAGAELSESLLTRLESMDVSHLVVEGQPVDTGGPGGTSPFDNRVGRLPFLFRKYQDDKWMTQIERLLDRYFKMRAVSSAAKAAARAASPDTATPHGKGD